MTTDPGGFGRLVQALQEGGGELQTAWIAAYGESPTRIPGAIASDELHALGSHLWNSLTLVFAPCADGLAPILRHGSTELREVEQAAAFLGGNLASSRASSFDVSALVLSLREVLLPFTEGATLDQLRGLIEWLSVVAADSFCTARVGAVDEKFRELLEEGTPLVQIVPELPAAMLIGTTDMVVVDSVLSRLLLTVVRVGARAVILDVAGVVDPTTVMLLERINRFLTHRKVEGRAELLVVGLASEHRAAWSALAGQVRFFEYFDGAVAEGLRLSGYRLVRTPTTGH